MGFRQLYETILKSEVGLLKYNNVVSTMRLKLFNPSTLSFNYFDISADYIKNNLQIKAFYDRYNTKFGTIKGILHNNAIYSESELNNNITVEYVDNLDRIISLLKRMNAIYNMKGV